MNEQFSESRSAAIQALLEEHVTTEGASALRKRRRPWFAGAALVLAGALAGTGVSAAAFALTDPAQSPAATEQTAIPAPPGVTPGQPIISLLGETHSQTTTGDVDILLAPAPIGATHLRVTLVCLTPSVIGWGIDKGGNNPSSDCTNDETPSLTAGYFDFPLDESTDTVVIRADDDASSIVTYQFLNYVPTAFGTNADGDSFGTDGGSEHPDLVAVIGTSPDGTQVDGYARASDLDAFGPDWPEQPSNPTEALAWQAERDAKYPDGWDIPVYKSDGKTQIGTFHIYNSSSCTGEGCMPGER